MKWVAVLVAAGLAGCSGDPGVLDDQDPATPAQARFALNETIRKAAYVGVAAGPFALNTGCGTVFWEEPGGPENIGGACFEMERGTEQIKFKVKDEVSVDVGIYVRYDEGAEGFFCNGGTFVPPDGARWVMFVILETACALETRPGTPTTGQIEVTMYHT